MDFSWTAEQREVHARMRALGAEADAAPPDERLSCLARGGALGLSLPLEHGGGGLDQVTTAYAYEALGATLRDGGTLLAAGAHLFGVASMVARVGTPSQRAALLPRWATGEAIATVAATEVESGSDVASVGTLAEHHGNGFRVTGKKRFVTWADGADHYFVVARNGKDGRGLTALVIPRTTPGLTVGPRLATAGLRGARLAPIELAGCVVGAEALFGRPGAGLAVFQIAMTFERALVLAYRLGALQRALDEAVKFARTREIGGAAIARYQAVSHRIARMKMRLEASRLLVYRAAWLLDQAERGQAEAALAKWHLAEAALASALDDVHIRGGSGFLEDSGMPAAVDDALGGSMHSGTQDVLATIVARWLGL